MPATIETALAQARAALEPLGHPASDADELLSRALGISRGQLQRLRAGALTPEQSERFGQWVHRRAAGEPVQYITGLAAFRGLDLQVDRRVLIPRPETEGLVECVLETLAEQRAVWKQPRVLDMGTGSGAIALSVAHEWPAARVFATDVSEDALAVARANAAACRLTDCVVFSHGHWFDAVGGDERFEVVVSNPPYISTLEAAELPADVRDWEPELALYSGESGNEALREIIQDAARHLVTHGLLALELAEMRAAQVASWLEGAHDWSSVELRDDLSGRPRVLLARRERGPAIAPAQWGEERDAG
ncbi:MAG: peptide chain release factor N(5)-glutamine methyltransferase [Candidatus Eisenbacteria bacterium]